MNLIIERIKSSGLRCPDYDIKLKEGPNFLVIPNGTGKTTTINLIKHTLSDDWDKDKVLKLRNQREAYESDESYLAEAGFFEMDVSINKTKYTFKVIFDLINGDVQYETRGPSGTLDRLKFPEEIRGYLSKEYVDLFAFSGDVLGPYFDPREGKVKDVLGAFTGEKKIKRILKEIKDQFDKDFDGNRRGKSSKFKEKRKKIDKIIDNLEENKRTLEAQKKIKEGEHRSISAQISGIEQAHEKYSERKEELEVALNDNFDHRSEQYEKIGDLMKNPIFFSNSLSKRFENFYNTLEINKLPGYSAKFFDHISVEDHCICSTPMNEQMKKNILENKNKYLSADDHTMALGIAGAIRDILEDDFDAEKEIKKLKQCEKECSEAKEELVDYIEKNSKKIGIEQLNKEENSLQNEISELKKKIDDITEPMFEERVRESQIKAVQIRDYETFFTSLVEAKAMKTWITQKEVSASSYEQYLKSITAFEDGVDEAAISAASQIKSDLILESNKKIGSVFGRQQIKIENMDNRIKLQGSEEGGSGAENTVSVTSFVCSLLERTSIHFPLLIDHPVITVANKGRQSLSKFLNNLSNQLICFVLSSETPFFVKKSDGTLHNYLKDSHFVTLARKSQIEAIYKSKKLPKDHTFSDNAFLTYDSDFFLKFDIEDEEEG